MFIFNVFYYNKSNFMSECLRFFCLTIASNKKSIANFVPRNALVFFIKDGEAINPSTSFKIIKT